MTKFTSWDEFNDYLNLDLTRKEFEALLALDPQERKTRLLGKCGTCYHACRYEGDLPPIIKDGCERIDCAWWGGIPTYPDGYCHKWQPMEAQDE